MKVRWTGTERAALIAQINVDKQDTSKLPAGVLLGLTDVYFDYLQEKILPPNRWIDWRDKVSVNPDIAACFGKKYATVIRVTRMGKPKLIENLEREIEEGKVKAKRDRVVATALENTFELAELARGGNLPVLRFLTILGGMASRIKTLPEDVSDDDLVMAAFDSYHEDKDPKELLGDFQQHLEESGAVKVEVPAPIEPPVHMIAPGVSLAEHDTSGPNETTKALREICSKKTRFVIVGALAKHQNQVDQALRGNESRIEIIWQPRCRNWKESVKNADAVMMSNLCDAPSRDSCKQYCKANSIPFEPSGTGKTAIVAWVARYTASDIKVDGRWIKDKATV